MVAALGDQLVAELTLESLVNDILSLKPIQRILKLLQQPLEELIHIHLRIQINRIAPIVPIALAKSSRIVILALYGR